MAVGPIRVLHVGDCEDLELVRDEGMEVAALRGGETALERFDQLAPDVVLLDASLPGIDGISICRRLRARSAVPVIVLCAEPEAAVRALDAGADDFVAKPFDRRELVARIRAQVRRARGELVAHARRVEVGPLVVDLASRAVTLRDAPVALTSTELAVLAALAAHAGKALSREQLLHLVHGTDEVAFDRSIDVAVSRLRAKLERDPRHPELILTVRGVGYMLAARALTAGSAGPRTA